MGDLTTCPLREDPCWLWGTVQPKVQRIIDTSASVVLPTVRRSARHCSQDGCLPCKIKRGMVRASFVDNEKAAANDRCRTQPGCVVELGGAAAVFHSREQKT